MPEKRCQRKKHPGLGPAHVRYFIFVIGGYLVVEAAAFIPHVGHCPLQNGIRQGLVIRIKIDEGYKRYNALSDTVNVDGIDAVMKIFGHPVFPKKVFAVKFEPATDVGFEFIRCQLKSDVS